ncbi:MAG: hypothetical protein HUU23_00490 [Caldilineales bacterium]|nr:hypothetical protein [Caldilineales bacterium]
MFNYLRTLRHPARYHGFDKKPPFFEGWYFKLIDASEQHRYALIPGIFISADPARRHAFIQVLNGSTGQAHYFQYPAAAFGAARDRFEVQIGASRFCSDAISLQIDQDGQSLRGDVRFLGTTPWPVTWRSPGIMGWYAWVPGMECYHGVLSFDHELQGGLTFAGAALDFSGGRGYIEKDWGQSFPAAWIWMQTNHFAVVGVSLTASIAIIPWRRSAFPGFIIGLRHEGRLYRFATYTGAVIERLLIADDHVWWMVADRDYRLEMKARRAEGGLLYGPTRQEMHKRVDETLNAAVEVRLSEKGGRVLFTGIGRHAGMEVQGDLDRLLALQTQT